METILQQITAQISKKISTQMLQKMQTIAVQMGKQVAQTQTSQQTQPKNQQQPSNKQPIDLQSMISPVQPDQVALLANRRELIKFQTAFVYLILSVVSWLKLPILAIFGLFVFFGLPLTQLAPEMIPNFYGDYILPWLPIRFLTDGMKEILYFGESVINPDTNVLIGIGIGGFILLWLKNFFTKPSLTEKAE